MNPVKTIRINEGAIDYIFTIYQEIEALLPNTDKLESALLAALKVLCRVYQRVDFHVLHTPREWRLVFTVSPCSDSRSISTNLAISSTQYLTTGSSELGGIVSGFVSRSINELLGNQKWKITRRDNDAYTYLVEVIGGLEYIRFEIDDIRTVSIESDEISFDLRPAQIRVQRWIEISAEVERGACQISHNNLMINGLKLDVFTLGFYNYTHATRFTIKPNIISGSMRQQGEIVTFETAPIQERANKETARNVAMIQESINRNFRNTAPVREFLNEIANTSGRNLTEELEDYFPREATNTGYLKRNSAINNKTCKYFNQSAYLKCAVNPSGTCEGCKDYERNQ
jgi:hypothetical protein